MQAREYKGEGVIEPVEKIGFLQPNNEKDIVKIVTAIEEGRRLARDIGGGDPERMTPKRSAEYLLNAFNNVPNIKIHLIDDNETLLAQYPLLHAVARCSIDVCLFYFYFIFIYLLFYLFLFVSSFYFVFIYLFIN